MKRSMETASAFAKDVIAYTQYQDLFGLELTLARHARYDATFAAATAEMAALGPVERRIVLHWLEASRDPERRGFWRYADRAEAFVKLGVPSLTGLFGHDQQVLAGQHREPVEIAA